MPHRCRTFARTEASLVTPSGSRRLPSEAYQKLQHARQAGRRARGSQPLCDSLTQSLTQRERLFETRYQAPFRSCQQKRGSLSLLSWLRLTGVQSNRPVSRSTREQPREMMQITDRRKASQTQICMQTAFVESMGCGERVQDARGNQHPYCMEMRSSPVVKLLCVSCRYRFSHSHRHHLRQLGPHVVLRSHTDRRF